MGEKRPLLSVSSLNSEVAAVPPMPPKVDGFGCRRIGFLGGCCLLLNNMTGPGMVQIPVLYSSAGWLIPTLLMVIVMVISSFASTMLTEAMTLTPGNNRLQKRMELESLAKEIFGKWGYRVTVVLLLICLQATNVAAIVVSAQVMDYALVAMKGTCGLEFYPHFGGVCVTSEGNGISPFGSVIICSLGFIAVLIMAVPMGYFNLEDNIYVQVVATILMLVIIAEWVVCFCMVGVDPSQVPVVGDVEDAVTAVGTIIFNYAFVVTIPSWVNEKRPSVSVNKSIWLSNLAATLLFLIVGFGGAWTFQFPGNADILTAIDAATGLPKGIQIFSQVAVYLFPIVVLVSGIPVYSIIVRYNLMEAGICGKRWANVWGVILPWVVAVPFYTGSGLSNIIAWTGLIVNGAINFIIPFVLYIMARRQASRRAVITQYHLNTAMTVVQEAEAGGITEDMHSVPLRIQRCLRLTTTRCAWGVLAVTVALLLFTYCVDIYYLAIGTNVLAT